MGYLQAREMARLADLDTALEWHLRANHYPPVPSLMVPVCKRAIEAALNGDWQKEILLPEGVTYREDRLPYAREVIITFHLEAFLDH